MAGLRLAVRRGILTRADFSSMLLYRAGTDYSAVPRIEQLTIQHAAVIKLKAKQFTVSRFRLFRALNDRRLTCRVEDGGHH